MGRKFMGDWGKLGMTRIGSRVLKGGFKGDYGMFLGNLGRFEVH